VKMKFESAEQKTTGAAWIAPSYAAIFTKRKPGRKKGFGKARWVSFEKGGSIPFVTQMYDTFQSSCVLIGSAS